MSVIFRQQTCPKVYISLRIYVQYGLVWSSAPHQFSRITQSCPILCDPMNCSTPGLPVHHQLPEFTQTHVHWVGDVIHSHSRIYTCRSLLKPNHTLAYKTQENSLPLTCHREISHVATPNLKRNEIKSYHPSIKTIISVFVSSSRDYCKHLHMM